MRTGKKKINTLGFLAALVVIAIFLSLYFVEKGKVRRLGDEINDLRSECEAKLAALIQESKPEAGAGEAAADEKVKGLADSVKFQDQASPGDSTTELAPGAASVSASDVPVVKQSPYFDVTGVFQHLNVRTEPGKEGAKAGEVPLGASCIQNMKDYKSVDQTLWIKIKYKSLDGWVHSDYVKPSTGSCP